MRRAPSPRLLALVSAASAAAFLTVGAARAQPSPAPATAAPSVAGWNELLDSLRDLPARILAKLPEEQRNDPQVQQEVGRLALGALTSSGISVLGGDLDHPMFLPLNGSIFSVGQPNSDTIYRTASIDPAGTYRLRGRQGTVRIARIGQMGPTPGDSATPPKEIVGAARAQHDLKALQVDAEGRFDVILSPARPPGYAGDWWRLEPSTAKLLLRSVSSDWSQERDPTISIERLDKPARQTRPSAEALRDRLRRLAILANFIGPLRAGEPERLRREGHVNRLHTLDVSRLGGLAGQFYYDGVYELKDDEALVVEVKIPAKCVYWSLILTNEIYETTDWYDNQSSLNDAQARIDKDGLLRVVVSAKDPGVPNWLDTAGYSTGVLQGRWTDCDAQPIPAVRKMALDAVRSALPSDTANVSPKQRERAIRERRAAYQQRPLW
ncbi:DUF1214 domain-containing protein [Phenylobacterium sp. LjRoot225]|uniref:DUF1214 domain-containing protein n=1 Tax=Phenylobacterium sp. LjRoot225 TaxID=3342285 RepID=UPI003ED05AD6